ncbi:MAG: hypothetical protein ACTSPD_00540 [Promethearchaeota archaeon]
MSETKYIKKCFCWNGCDDKLHRCIERNKFVKQVRYHLMQKKIKDRLLRRSIK